MKIENIESENQLYNTILDRLASLASEREEDPCWESQTYVELMQILKSGKEPSDGAVRNSIIMLLALFSPRYEGVDLWGTDVQKLKPQDRQQLIYELLDALPAPVSH